MTFKMKTTFFNYGTLFFFFSNCLSCSSYVFPSQESCTGPVPPSYHTYHVGHYISEPFLWYSLYVSVMCLADH